MDGFKWHFGGKNLVTVWSAPNYGHRSGNKACVMRVNGKAEPTFDVFEAVPTAAGTQDDSVLPYFA
jgi:hypothetical protein